MESDAVYLEKITAILKEAGDLLLEGLHSGKREYTRKGSVDLVTYWDTRIEQRIIARLQHDFPDHGIIGEESGKENANRECCFIIDPIDGTTNFVHGFPFCCISIACAKNGIPVAGGVYAPALDKLYLAARGGGAYCNEERISVSDVKNCEEALFVTGFSYERKKQKDQLIGIVKNGISSFQGVRRTGSAALDLCFTAEGIFDFYLETGIQAWDIAAGALFVEEAGGRVSMLDGDRLDLFGRQIAAGNPHLFDTARTIVLEDVAL